MLTILVVFSMASAALSQPTPTREACAMSPPRASFTFPDRGWVRMDDERPDPCPKVSSAEWKRKRGAGVDLMVHPDGPAGSGRYWDVTVAIAAQRAAHPARGFCFRTSTVGWRTLQGFADGPLPWIDDRDGDARPELVLWESFPLGPDRSNAEFALVAWVYELNPKGVLVLDWDLSRSLARRVAMAYRAPLSASNAVPQTTRVKAAEALEALAHNACTAERPRERR